MSVPTGVMPARKRRVPPTAERRVTTATNMGDSRSTES